ncbi:ArsR/SmtB family transcription factor [Pseudonocardia adelaidensis]|uniref:Helix-turn-helix transcriptional regulator n=1 Tax=Pseudonocardia adelaidensis TaxID=648754 RepID=A0ABP9NJF4_9PSEU
MDAIPPPLPEPAPDDIRLEDVFGALNEPLRLGVVRKLLLEAPGTARPCGWVGIDPSPKSTLTHHFRILREAGVTRQRQYGLERRSEVRISDLDSRFPGLLDPVQSWQPSVRQPG